MRWILGTSIGLVLSLVAVLASARETAPPARKPAPQTEGARFFEAKIRPLFAQQCFGCHGDKLQKGGLRLDEAAAFRKGGDSGPAIVPGDPAKSLLLQAVRHEGPVKMPPQGKLNAEQVADLAVWIRMGAPWPEYGAGAPGAAVDGGSHWSFTPVKPRRLPPVKNQAWVRNPIDRFVLAKLEAKGLQPNPPADPRALIRRAYFDLIGLPPAPEEVDAFVKECGDPRQSNAAYERLIDRLLARPQFGERWGRHWLDVVRYAQTNGYERDDEKPHVWRYRDYVIQSFNGDKPYNRFIQEQLAGDELDGAGDEAFIATGFYRLGVWDDEPDDARQAEFDNLDDALSTTGQAFMGLTIGCARCRPDPAADYYGMLAFLRNLKRQVKADDKTADETIFASLKGGGKAFTVFENGPKAPEVQVLLRGNAATPGPTVAPHFVRALCASDQAATPSLPQPAPTARTSGRRQVLAEWIANPEHPLTSRVMVNRVWQHLFGSGIVATPNDFGRTGTLPTHPELLDWLALGFAGGNGETGKRENGDPVARPWSVKSLIRLVMMSNTYRQSSRVDNPKAATADPSNTLLWRQNLRRLEAEAIRDSILATSGKLNLAMGGQGIYPELPPEVLSTQSRPGNGWGKSSEAERSRRSVYIFIKRTLGVPFLESFDATTPDSPVGVRAVTTIAPQALILLNSAFMDEQSAAFAERLLKEAPADPAARIERAFRLAVARKPSVKELTLARAYLDRQRQACGDHVPHAEAERRSLAAFCKLVLNLNEFVYVD